MFMRLILCIELNSEHKFFNKWNNEATNMLNVMKTRKMVIIIIFVLISLHDGAPMFGKHFCARRASGNEIKCDRVVAGFFSLLLCCY